VPAIAAAGAYDVTVVVDQEGVTTQDTFYSGLMVDAPLRFVKATPQFGPVHGGTTVTIYGEGFEPGTSVTDGLRVLVGDQPVKSIDLLSTEQIQVVTAGGEPGLHPLIGRDQYGHETQLAGGFGYGLKRLAHIEPSIVKPTEIYIDKASGVAVTTGGYFSEAYIKRTLGGLDFPDSLRAASFDVQEASSPLFVGGESALPSNQSDLDRILTGNFAVGVDSLRMQMVREFEDDSWHNRLYVASGIGGVSRLNLDDQNSLNYLGSVGAASQNIVTSLYKAGHALYATRSSVIPSDGGAEVCTPMPANAEFTDVAVFNYRDPHDPISFTALKGIDSGSYITGEGSWIYAGGGTGGVSWVGDCSPLWPKFGARLSKATGDSTISGLDLMDPFVNHSYSFNGNVQNFISYGDYLIVALGGKGFVVQHKNRDDLRHYEIMDATVSESSGEILSLKMAGSTLIVAAGTGGIRVYDLREPLQPKLITSGNDEPVVAVDIFKERLVTADGASGLSVFELPGALVTGSEPAYQQLTPYQPNLQLSVTFNEPVTLASLHETEAITLRRIGADTTETKPFTVAALDGSEGSTASIRIDFAAEPSSQYELSINRAKNLRGGTLWVPFMTRFSTTTEPASAPKIAKIIGGSFHKGDERDLYIQGTGFNPDALKLYLDQHELAIDRSNSNDHELRLTAATLSGLPLEPGAHHLKVSDHGISDTFLGAIVIAEPLTAQTKFTLSTTSGPKEGGNEILISSTDQVILPGTKVLMRSSSGAVEIKSGVMPVGATSLDTPPYDLHDDVRTLNAMSFTTPQVVTADRFGIYLLIPNGQQSSEVYVGDFIYTLGEGLTFQLPYHPPLQTLAAKEVDHILFAGVAGPAPAAASRSSIEAGGLEIFDLSIRQKPILLAQKPLGSPVHGLDLLDDALFLAAGERGLLAVNVKNPNQPLVVQELSVGKGYAWDVALRSDALMALAVGSDAGQGYVGFIDAYDSELAISSSVPPLLFNSDELRGEPRQVRWFNHRLHVVLVKADEIWLAVFDDISRPTQYRLTRLGRLSDPDVSLAVGDGIASIASGADYLIMHETGTGSWQESYWSQNIEASFGEKMQVPIESIYTADGAVQQASSRGITQLPAPRLAVSRVVPADGEKIERGQTIKVELNGLINTNATVLAAAVKLLDGSQNPLDAAQYEVKGINTVTGAAVSVAFRPESSYTGPFTLLITQELLSLAGETLSREYRGSYTLISGKRPLIDKVVKESSGSEQLPYFHANGNEIAIIYGAQFGADASNLEVKVGKTVVTVTEVKEQPENTIKFIMPTLQLGSAALLPVTVTKKDSGLSQTRFGAITVLPAMSVASFIPLSGTPQGGNWVDIYGSGFSDSMQVKFGESEASDLTVYSSTHLAVRAPAGNFGTVAIKVASQLFPGEFVTAPQSYSYLNGVTGTLTLSGDDNEIIYRMAQKDQLLYTITGGAFEVVNSQGEQVGRIPARTAALMAVNVSNPVHPVPVLKDGKPWQFKLNGMDTGGFVDVITVGQELYLASRTSLYHFDVTLAAEPVLLETLPVTGTEITSLTASGPLLFVGTDRGITIYRSNDSRRLEQVALLGGSKLGGKPGVIKVIDDHLWVLISDAPRILSLELMSGDYKVQTSLTTQEAGGTPWQPTDMILSGRLLLVSSGWGGKIYAYYRSGTDLSPVATLPLIHLTPGGAHAGSLALYGQTLYVAAGQGDLQVFDISNWLQGIYQAPLMKNYFAMKGSVNSVVMKGGTLFAATGYAQQGENDLENPLDHLSGLTARGAIHAIVSNDMSVVDIFPTPDQVLPKGSPIKLQFTHLLDTAQTQPIDPQLLTMSLDGSAQSGFLAADVVSGGSQLTLQPAGQLAYAKQYQVRLSGLSRNIHGRTVGDDFLWNIYSSEFEAPHITNVIPNQASYHGDVAVTLKGSGFGAASRVIIGESIVPDENILQRNAQEITFRLPPLNNIPETNKLVGIRVLNESPNERNGIYEPFNGETSELMAGAFTYVTDPKIVQVGRYDLQDHKLLDGIESFAFGAGETVAIRAEGISPDTVVALNGKKATEIGWVGSDMITVRLPDNLIGKFTITLSNNPAKTSGPGTANIEQLRVELVPTEALAEARLVAKNRNLMLAAHDTTAELYRTDNGTIQPLATFTTAQPIQKMALSERYVLTASGNNPDLAVYDLGENIYQPKEVARLVNHQKLAFKDLQMSGETIVGLDGDNLLMTHVAAAAIRLIPLFDALDQEHVQRLLLTGTDLFILFDHHLELRSLYDPMVVRSRIRHNLTAPQLLSGDGSRLIIASENGLELIDMVQMRLARNEADHEFENRVRIGIHTFITGNLAAELAYEGELVAVRWKESETITLYDLDRQLPGGQLALRLLSSVRCPNAKGSPLLPGTLSLLDGIVGWLQTDGYHQVQHPFNNIMWVVPTKIGNANETLFVNYNGRDSDWRTAQLKLQSMTTGEDHSGSTQMGQKRLEFTPAAQAYDVASGYLLRLAPAPTSWLEGGATNFDLPYSVYSAPLFGVAEVALHGLAPAVVKVGADTQFTLSGQNLGEVKTLTLGNQLITPSSWQVVADGSRLTFHARLDTLGLTSLKTTTTGDPLMLAAALQVVAPLTISSVASERHQPDTISSAGGDTITASGSGFDSSIELYFMPAGSGITASAANRLEYDLTDGVIRFVVPEGVTSGWKYDVVLHRPLTGETLSAAAAGKPLSCVDDQRPLVQIIPMSKEQNLALVAEEPITAASFKVTQAPLSYNSGTEQDVTTRFTLQQASASRLEVALKSGEVLRTNSCYRIEVKGIRDSSGNLAASAAGDNTVTDGTLIYTYTSADTLGPNEASLKIVHESNPNLQFGENDLVRGISYNFIVTAEDNVDLPAEMSFSYRLSTDGGLTFGAVTPIISNTFNVAVALQSGDAVVLIRATDTSHNTTEKRFTAHVRTAWLELLAGVGFFTNPSQAYEMNDITLNFKLQGDVNLLRAADMRVMIGAMPQPASFDPISGVVSYRWSAPRMRDLTAQGEAIAPKVLPVRLRAFYGAVAADQYRTFEQQFTLYPDSTPPLFSILSPKNGEHAPRGETVSLVFSSSDAVGVAKVEVCISAQNPASPFGDSAACHVTDNPQSYLLQVAEDAPDPLVIHARATDHNGNVSATQSVALHPYASTEGYPRLALLAPQNGTSYPEGAPIKLMLSLHQVISAKVSMEVGGNPNDSRNRPPITVTRAASDPEVMVVETTVPAVGESTVVLVRVTSTLPAQGVTPAEMYLNVVKDGGIDQTVDMTVMPSHEALAGGDMWVTTRIPADMTDYAATSQVLVRDGDLPAAILPFGEPPRRVSLASSGSSVNIEAQLKDLSAAALAAEHIKSLSKTVPKRPYFAADKTQVWQADSSDKKVVQMALLPGLDADGGMLLGVQKGSDGFEIRSASGVLFSETKGQLTLLNYTGSGLLGAVTKGGDRYLYFWPLQAGVLQNPVSQPIYGDILGGSSDLIWLAHGSLISAVQFNGTSFIPVSGTEIAGTILHSQVAGDHLYILTAEGLYNLKPDFSRHPEIVVAFFTGLKDRQSFHVHHDELYAWSTAPCNLKRYRLLGDGSLVILEDADLGCDGPVLAQSDDGDILWLKIRSNSRGTNWQAYRNGAMIGILPGNSELLLFTPGALFAREKTAERDLIMRRTIHSTALNVSLNPQLEPGPLGIMVSLTAAPTVYGANKVHFISDGKVIAHRTYTTLPAELGAVYQESWFVAYKDIAGGNLSMVWRDHDGNDQSTALTVGNSSNYVDNSFLPVTGSTLTRGARVALAAIAPGPARFSSSRISWGNQSQNLIYSKENIGYFWLDLPNEGAGIAPVFTPDSAAGTTLNYTLGDNTTATSINLTSPQSGSNYREGDLIEISYQSALGDENDSYQYSEIALLDVNGATLQTLFARHAVGNLKLRLPAVANVTNYKLKVRSYYGTRYAYAEALATFTVAPRIAAPTVSLVGLDDAIYAGSVVNLRLEPAPQAPFSGTISIFDEAGNLLIHESELKSYTIPEKSALRIEARVKDGFGNEEVLEKNIRIGSDLKFEPSEVTQEFTAMATGAGQRVFSRSEKLYDKNGVLLTQLEGDITAIVWVNEYLLVAVEDRGLILLDPQDHYKILSRLPYQSHIPRMIPFAQGVVARVNDNLTYFKLSGTELTLAKRSTTLSNVRDFIPLGNEIAVMEQNSLALVDASLTVKAQVYASALVPGSDNGFTAMAWWQDRLLLSDSHGNLNIYSTRDLALIGQLATSFTLPAFERLIPLQGELLALSVSENNIYLLDLASFPTAKLVGRYPFALGQLAQRSELSEGKLWLPESGLIINLARKEGATKQVFNSRQQLIALGGSATALNYSDTALVAAMNQFGAAFLRDLSSATPSMKIYPKTPYSQDISVLKVATEGYYLINGSASRLSLYQPQSSQLHDLLQNTALLREFVITPTRLAAAASDQLLFINRSELQNISTEQKPFQTLTIAPGEMITTLTALDESVWVATSLGKIYKVTFASDLASSALVFSIGAGVTPKNLLCSGDYLFFIASDNSVGRIKLADYTLSTLNVPDATFLKALSLNAGYLWAAYDSGPRHELQAFQLHDLTALSGAKTALDSTLSALTLKDRALAVGMGIEGVRQYELSHNMLSANPALATPEVGTLLNRENPVTLSLAHPAGIQAVSYYINNRLVKTTNFPFLPVELELPAWVASGSTIELKSQVETFWGEVLTSEPRQLMVRGSGQQPNPFTIELVASVLSYGPAPFRAEATIHDSLFAISHVEFLVAAAAEGPWQLIARRLGPQYLLEAAFGPERDGHFILARAFDMQGNMKESIPLRFSRKVDSVAPTASITAEGVGFSDSQLVRGVPYKIRYSLLDNESGIQRALLKRNGTLIHAAYGDGSHSIDQVAPQGETCQYELTVEDLAGNVTRLVQSYSITENAAPLIALESVSTQITEQGDISVAGTVQDNTGVDRIEFIWNGYTTTLAAGGDDTYAFNHKVHDQRASRLTAMMTAPLLVRAYDKSGLMSEQSREVQINVDAPPAADKLRTEFAAHGFYGTSLPVQLSNLDQVDDNLSRGLSITLQNYAGTVGGSFQDVATQPQITTPQTSFLLPLPVESAQQDRAYFRFIVADHLFQQATSPEYSVTLTSRPNLVTFYKSPLTPDLNPTEVRSGYQSTYQVLVIDAASRPITDMNVMFSLIDLATGASSPLSSSVTNSEGLARLTLTPNKPVGSYRLQAELPEFPTLESAQWSFSIEAGDVAKLVFNYVPDPAAGEIITLRAAAYDSADNLVSRDSVTRFIVMASDPTFHFGLQNGVTIETVEGRERATCQLAGGMLDIALSVATKAGTGSLALTPAADSGNFTFYYDHDDRQLTPPQIAQAIPVKVRAGAPAAYRLAFAASAVTNGTTPPVFSTYDAAAIELFLADAYGNKISYGEGVTPPADANATLTLAANNGGNINGTPGVGLVTASRGSVTFAVTNSNVGTTTVAITAMSPVMPEINLTHTLDVQFAQMGPRIMNATYQVVHNSKNNPFVFTFNHPVSMGLLENRYLHIALDSQDLTGDFSIDNDKVIFMANTAPALDRCYSYRTFNVRDGLDTQLKDAANDLPVARQTGDNLCTPQLYLAVTANNFALETKEYLLKLDVADSIDIKRATKGVLKLNERTLDFDFATQTITMPSLTELGVNDGALVKLSLTGEYVANGEIRPLRVGNTIDIRVLSAAPDADYDQDGISNLVEHQTGELNPLTADSNDDGTSDSNEDMDGDGLSNREEMVEGSSLKIPDSDGDTLTDGTEVHVHGTSPVKADTDNDGISDAEELAAGTSPVAADSTPPTAMLTSPATGRQLVRGETVILNATVHDDGKISEVQFMAAGHVIATVQQAPYSASYAVAENFAAATLSLEVKARDSNNNQGTSGALTFEVIDDPLTTVQGMVKNFTGVPVSNANLSVLGQQTVSASDGKFTLADVPTNKGELSVKATAVFSGELISVTTRPVTPVRGGITDLGTIVLDKKISRVGYYDLSLNEGAASQLPAIVALGLIPVKIGDLRSAAFNDIDILMIQNPSNFGYNATYLRSLPKIEQFVRGGGILIFHDRHVRFAREALPLDEAAAGWNFSRELTSPLALVPSGALASPGMSGMLSDLELNMGRFAGHGYASLAAPATTLITTEESSNAVLFSYKYGTGYVIYGAIPLDHFLLYGPAAMRDKYAPNVLEYANKLLQGGG
jgi:hypothetical protein